MPSVMLFLVLIDSVSSLRVAAFSSWSSSSQQASPAFVRLKARGNSECNPLESSAREPNQASNNEQRDYSDAYIEAWGIRTRLGHHAAVPYYKRLLSESATRDTSAATQIAASDTSLKLLNQVGRVKDRDIANLRAVLKTSHYNHSTIRESIFNLPVGPSVQHTNPDSFEIYKNNYPFGPIYARPLQPGQYLDVEKLLSDTNDTSKSSLQCLTILFILASCIPKSIFLRSVYGGVDTLDCLLRLGLVFISNDHASEVDLIVPLVHLFPLDIPHLIPAKPTDKGIASLNNSNKNKADQNGRSLIFMTDLHPNVLGLTSIPVEDANHTHAEEDGTVMYIGPDSLALVHHLHANFMQYYNSRQRSKKQFRLVDFCAGSGVQALATLSMLELFSDKDVESCDEATAVAVDINQRALRFTRFNSILNGFVIGDLEPERFADQCSNSKMKVYTIQADLVSGEVFSSIEKDDTRLGSSRHPLLDELLLIPKRSSSKSMVDLVLANPPFIPTPPKVSDNRVLSIYGGETNVSIPMYGLFSSGGEDGEECLRAIVQMAPNLLNHDGLAAVVSEFMNPPAPDQSGLDPSLAKRSLCSKIQGWWSSSCSQQPVGVLFTNEYAISSTTYAERRAIPGDANDLDLWNTHLHQKGISSVSKPPSPCY
jgi:methylase of polypeptide subunit release factors